MFFNDINREEEIENQNSVNIIKQSENDIESGDSGKSDNSGKFEQSDDDQINTNKLKLKEKINEDEINEQHEEIKNDIDEMNIVSGNFEQDKDDQINTNKLKKQHEGKRSNVNKQRNFVEQNSNCNFLLRFGNNDQLITQIMKENGLKLNQNVYVFAEKDEQLCVEMNMFFNAVLRNLNEDKFKFKKIKKHYILRNLLLLIRIALILSFFVLHLLQTTNDKKYNNIQTFNTIEIETDEFKIIIVNETNLKFNQFNFRKIEITFDQSFPSRLINYLSRSQFLIFIKNTLHTLIKFSIVKVNLLFNLIVKILQFYL